MSSNSDSKNHVTSGLHPRVYTALIIFALWFALAVWSFAGPGETDYLLVIVSGFICVVVSLLLIMGRLHRADQATTEDEDKVQTFREWLQASFDTERDRMTGAEAAVLILLPIAVAAIGMMAFGIIFQIVEHAGT